MLKKWLKKEHRAAHLISFSLLFISCSTIANIDTESSDCNAITNTEWSEVEKWVWGEICQSEQKTVDLNDYDANNRTPFEITKQQNLDFDVGNEGRLLSQAFIKDILLNSSLKSIIGNSGITIRNAFFNDSINLDHARINFPLKLESTLFESAVDLNYIKVKDTLSFNHSVFRKKLSMTAATITGDVFMNKTRFNSLSLANSNIKNSLDLTGATDLEESGIIEMDSISTGDDMIMPGIVGFKGIVLEAAKIGGSLDMTNALITGKLDMDSIVIDGNLLLRKKLDESLESPTCEHKLNNNGHSCGEFSQVDLPGAEIKGRVSLSGAKFTGKLNMDAIIIREDLLMRDALFEGDVMLTDAFIGDQLSMSCSRFKDVLKMDSIEIGSHLYMNSSYPKTKDDKVFNNNTLSTCQKSEYQDISLNNSTIGHHMEMKDVTVEKNLDMSSSRIKGSLTLTKSIFGGVNLQFIRIDENLDINEISTTSLKLNNAKVNTVHMPNKWPEKKINETKVALDLSGFEYQKIENVINADWQSSVISGFRKMSYTPQPYVQLAVALNSMAHKNEAKSILVAKFDHERDHTDDLMTKIKLTILKIFIGYGYGYAFGYFNSLAFALIFILTGILVLRHERRKMIGKDDKSGYLDDLFYSLDSLLPIISINKKHEEMHHDILLVRCYFYFHKIMGYILALTIAAGLSGFLAPAGA